ncbi:MAG: hypothetical protein JXX28_00840 [Deltaproteobacteria bacterium]|nr:hypothetical protein [Deltaproteobacteria bacterium]
MSDRAALWAILALSACGARDERDAGPLPSPLAELLPSVARDARGCWEDGPCLDPPAGGALTWTRAGEVCLRGERLGEEEGVVLLAGERVTPTRWSGSEACLAVDPAALDDGLVQLIAASGRRSNSLGFLTPPREVRLVIPPLVEVGTPVVVEGENLGYAHTGGPSVLGGSGRRVELTAWGAGAGQRFSFTKGGTTWAEATVDVYPRLLTGCAASSAATCEVAVLSLAGGSNLSEESAAAAGYTAQLGGLPAQLEAIRPTSASLRWPAGLEPGEHALVLRRPDGLEVRGAATLLADSPLRLGTEDPDGYYLELASPRPMVVGGQAWLHLFARSFLVDDEGVPFPGDLTHAMVRLDPSAQGEVFALPQTGRLSFNLDALGDGARVLPFHGRALLVETGGLWDLGSPEGPLEQTLRSSPLAAADEGYLADALVEGDEVITALALFYAETTALTAHRWDGATFTSRPLGSLNSAPGLIEGRRIQSPGTALSAAGVYQLPSRSDGGQPQAIRFWPWGEDHALGDPEEVWSGAGERIYAARALPDGLLFAAGDGIHTGVYRHGPDGTAQIAEPALPAVALPERGRAPVQDLALASDGALVLLVADRSGEAEHLRLMSLRGGAWTYSEPFGGLMSAERGEVCAGPVSRASCPTVGLYGCAPAACPVQPATLVARERVAIGEAALSLEGDTALVTWTSAHLDAPAAYRWGLTEAWMSGLAVP